MLGSLFVVNSQLVPFFKVVLKDRKAGYGDVVTEKINDGIVSYYLRNPGGRGLMR